MKYHGPSGRLEVIDLNERTKLPWNRYLLTEPLSVGPRVANVPNGPGLGVELDEDQLQRWRV